MSYADVYIQKCNWGWSCISLYLCLNITCQNIICPRAMLWLTIALKSKPCGATCIYNIYIYIFIYIYTEDNLPWPCNSMKFMLKQSRWKFDLLRNHAMLRVCRYVYALCHMHMYIYICYSINWDLGAQLSTIWSVTQQCCGYPCPPKGRHEQYVDVSICQSNALK